jgi:hypothetical protein
LEFIVDDSVTTLCQHTFCRVSFLDIWLNSTDFRHRFYR